VNPAAYSIRMVDKVKVKGKSELVTVYEVFDADAEENRQGKLDTLEKFSEALRYYYDLQDIETSARLFAECLAHNPHDTVAKIYLDRCHNPEHSVLGA
jgi:two-component system sensor histidine kinase ChiS